MIQVRGAQVTCVTMHMACVALVYKWTFTLKAVQLYAIGAHLSALRHRDMNVT
jgi:uncharacterized membrane protein